jgi:diguanylate cyclase (GGDEF)-like protein
VRDHASVSADIIKPIFPEEVYLAVRHHHERWDGKGYPEGRKAAELPQLARVLTLVDAYDAMTTGSTHSRARTYDESVAELRRCAGKQFDPDLIPRFIEVLGELEESRQAARAAAEAAAGAIDWPAHATLRTAGGAGREHYPPIEQALERVRTAHPRVARLFTAVPDERGYVLALGSTAGFSLPQPGEEIHPPAELVESSAGAPPEANVLNIDAHGCWMSGFVPILDSAGRLTAFVEADVPVETDVRGGAMPGADVGETLDSILRQAAARMTRIEMAANTDGLSGLYNHRYFQERLEQELARARAHGESLGLLFCDLDHFKLYNDTAGHQAGDEALRRLAAILHEELRRIDIAARYGGEEFAVILPDTHLQGAVEVAERVRRAVEKSHATGPPLTVSIGAATFPADAASAAELIDRADWAMYLAKRKGRNRVEVFGAGDEGAAGD